MTLNNRFVNDKTNPKLNTVLLLIDVVTNFDFIDGEKLYKTAEPMIKRLAKFKQSAKAAGIPVIYVNDNFGKWHDDFGSFVHSIESSSDKGQHIVDLIRPEPDDFHVTKPQRSGFYATPLGVILMSMNASNLIITGMTTDICILFTAHDAYMRGFHVQVPSDCTAAVEDSYHKSALKFIERVAEADIRPLTEIDFGNISSVQRVKAAGNDICACSRHIEKDI